MMITKVYVPGIGWMRQGTLEEIWDYIFRETLMEDCKDPSGIKIEEWNWYNCN